MPDRYLLVLVREPEFPVRSPRTTHMAQVRKILHRGVEEHPTTLGVVDIPVPQHMVAEADALMEAAARYAHARWGLRGSVWDPRGKPAPEPPGLVERARRVLTSVTSRR